jgi:ankyrin repeat protein
MPVDNYSDNEALVAAARSGDATSVSTLLSREGIKVDYRRIGEDTTPLGHACIHGHVEVVKLLLLAGANVLEVDDCYMTPLLFAMSHNHESIVQLLLKPSLEAREDDNTTILHWMAAAGATIPQFQRVLDMGCDATVRDEEGRLAWEWAAENSNNGIDGVVVVLLREAAEGNVTTATIN